MVKELMLVSRVLYVGMFLLIGMLNAPFGINGSIFGFLFMLALSFVWQYWVLYFALRATANKKSRNLMLLGWMIVSSTICIWGFVSLISIDYLQENFDLLMRSFSMWMSTYLIGASMFIGGACARRAYTKHGAL